MPLPVNLQLKVINLRGFWLLSRYFVPLVNRGSASKELTEYRSFTSDLAARH